MNMGAKAISQRYMVTVGKGNFFESKVFPIDVGGVWRQEVPLQLVLQQHVVLRRKGEACSEKQKQQHTPVSE